MSEQVNIYEAKTTLSKLVERVEAGEEIVIARHGRPVASLVPVRHARPHRTPGSLRGRIRMAPDMDAVDEEVAAMLEDGPVDPPGVEPR